MHKFKTGDLVTLNAKANSDAYLCSRYGFVLAEIIRLDKPDKCPIIVPIINFEPVTWAWTFEPHAKDGMRFNNVFLNLVFR